MNGSVVRVISHPDLEVTMSLANLGRFVAIPDLSNVLAERLILQVPLLVFIRKGGQSVILSARDFTSLGQSVFQ